MKKKRKSKTYIGLIVCLFVFGIGALLVYKEQLKVTVVNSFTETSADVQNYFILGAADKDLNSLKELGVENKKTFVFVSSNWCSLCDALTMKLKSNTGTNDSIQIYEADLDDFRPLLSEFEVSNAPELILIENDNFRVIKNVSFNNIDQILATEINN
jgi:thiol-disulfide isomerase/thioredoxin